MDRLVRMLGCSLLIFGGFQYLEAADVVLPVPPPASLRVERLPLRPGAELITFFERLPEGELPLMAVLRDTLDDTDPSNDRIRQVWVFTYTRPSVWQRMVGGTPFLYHRARVDKATNRVPKPVMDLGNPSRGMWAGLAMAAVQSEVVNPVGAMARLTTHSFFGNYGEYRNTHIWEAADVLSLESAPVAETGFTADEMASVRQRMELTGHPLGGLVAEEFLTRDQEKLRALQTETRGHNWDLLRQRAEDSGLYLQPLAGGKLQESMAILWVAETDLEDSRRAFDGQFLNISKPFLDEKLRHWAGYTETWNLNRQGVMVAADDAEGAPVKMIPLAMYGLDHPKTPLLLVDFRGSGHAPRREISLKIAEDVTTGVFAFTGFANVGFVAAKTGMMFIQTRHGGATNRAARRRDFVLVRHAIGVDAKMNPALRKELLSRIEKVDVNPMESSWSQEVKDGRKQYEALVAYAQETGLAKEIAKSRGDEVRKTAHGAGARVVLGMASIGTLGIYRHHEAVDDNFMVTIDQQRRTAWMKRQPEGLPPGQVAVAASDKDPVVVPVKSGMLP